jgi:hypothetical protein
MYPDRVPGSVEQIHVAAVESELPQPVGAVEVTADGVLGDRYAQSRDLTLIEAEALEGLREDTGIELSPAEVRRQVLTRGIRLNDLVGSASRSARSSAWGRSCASPATTCRGSPTPVFCAGWCTVGDCARTSSAAAE